MSNDALSVKLFPLHQTFSRAASKELVLVRVSAMKEATGPRPRLSTVLVLDVSGSMGGEPIRQVIRSAERLSAILLDDDSLGVVAFSDVARLVSPLRKLEGEARQELQREVRALIANGNTNMSGGLSMGALSFPGGTAEERQLLLLMSDGQPNVGSSSKEALSQEATMIKARGVAISSLGFGSSHNEDILSGIAEAGGGRYSFISDPKLAENSFAKALGAQRDVVAQSVRLSLRPSDGVEIVKIWGDPKTSFGADGLRISLQDLIAADELNIIVELQATPTATQESWSPLSAKVTWSALGQPADISASAALAVAVAASAGNTGHEAQAHIAITQAADLRVEARKLSDKRDFNGARQVLERAKQLIEEVPEFNDHETLRDAWEALVDDVEMMKKVPNEADYQNYKRSQRDYNDFAVGGLNARQQAVMSPSARAMSNRLSPVANLPKIRVWYQDKNSAPQSQEFQQTEISMGRTKDCALVLSSASISRRHAQILFHDGAYWLFDMGSTNGVQHNGVRTEKIKLSPGMRVQVGDFTLWIEQL